MKLRLTLNALCVLSFAAGLAGASTVINFDDIAGTPTALSTQYASQGVLFNAIEASSSFTFNVIPPSSPNYVTPFWNTTATGSLEFVNPTDSSVLAYVDTVSITMVGLTASDTHPGNFSGATIDA